MVGLNRANWRLRMIVLMALAVLVLGVTAAAYGALGTHDTAYGTGALGSETSGDLNTAFGFNALTANTTGPANTAVGTIALSTNSSGDSNTAIGYAALLDNTTGAHNTATGAGALQQNTTASTNTADGNNALGGNTTGEGNTATGYSALDSNSTGGSNTAVGYAAGLGHHANTTGSNNTFLGFNAALGSDTQINNATAVGANSVVSQSNSLVLGAPGANVGIDTANPQSRLQLGSGATSSFGQYLQLPVVTSAAATPPAADCNSSNLVGRLVLLQTTGKKASLSLWACSSTGVWTKI